VQQPAQQSRAEEGRQGQGQAGEGRQQEQPCTSPLPAGSTTAARCEASQACPSGGAGSQQGGPLNEDRGSTGAAPGAVWVPEGTAGQGTPAARLLRKLRWATLGPPYDWTRRAYRTDVQYQPLPQYLADLAVQLAAAAAGSAMAASQSDAAKSCRRGRTAQPDAPEGCRGGAARCGGEGAAAVGAGAERGRAGCMDSTLAGRSAAAGGNGGSIGEVGSESSVGRRPFCPDVALVNYYYEGGFPPPGTPGLSERRWTG
jgi:hypothetical protein